MPPELVELGLWVGRGVLLDPRARPRPRPAAGGRDGGRGAPRPAAGRARGARRPRRGSRRSPAGERLGLAPAGRAAGARGGARRGARSWLRAPDRTGRRCGGSRPAGWFATREVERRRRHDSPAVGAVREGVELTADQRRAALGARSSASLRGRAAEPSARVLPAPRRDRLGEDRGLPGGRARGARAGRGAIVLVPEIALTPQTMDRLPAPVRRRRSRCFTPGCRPAPATTSGGACARGEARICVGPRSAVFAPVRDPGLIVIDEEHDSSYKQESDPRYDAREVAEAAGSRVGRGAALRDRDSAPGELARARAARASEPRGRPAAAAGGGRRHARRRSAGPLHPRTARGVRRGRAPGRQGDPADQPPGLVHPSHLPLLRPRLGVPALRRLARPPSRRRPRAAITAATPSRSRDRAPSAPR